MQLLGSLFGAPIIWRMLATAALAAADMVEAETRILYVSNYAGPVSKLALTRTANPPTLHEVSSTLGCGLNPAWLEIDRRSGNIFCLNEAYTSPGSGSLVTFSKDLVLLTNQSMLAGPAASLQFAVGRLALAHMDAGALSVLDTNSAPPRTLQEFVYDLPVPGPNATLQYKPFIHGLALDPTGRYLVAFDRGSDLLRVYAIAGKDQMLVEHAIVQTKAGSGPRHGVFIRANGQRTFLYVLGELDNSVLAFKAIYRHDSMQLRPLFNRPIEYGEPGVALPSEISAHEGVHVLLSLRSDDRSLYHGRQSDSIFTYSADPTTGELTLVRATASGGRWPRSFAVTADGTLVAVGNQYSRPGSVLVFSRDPATGVIRDSDAVAVWTTDAALADGGSVSMLKWDDQDGR